jgi:hypothetical protein
VRDDGYGFVIVDTLARCAVGADENSARDMGIVVDSLTRVRDATPDGSGVVLAVHHSGKDGKTSRGSSALEAGVDTVYFTEARGSLVTASRTKRKDGPTPDLHNLTLQPVGDSCVLGVPLRSETPAEENPVRLILSQLFVSEGVSGAELKRIALDEYNMSRTTYHRRLSDLQKSGEVVNTGASQRPWYEWRGPVVCGA